MLKTRILTALVVAPPVLAILFFAPAVVFEALVAAVIVGGAWEWSGLMTCARRGRYVFTAIVALVVVAVGVWTEVDDRAFLYLLVAAFAWWLFAFGWLTLRPAVAPGYALQGLCGLLTLVPTYAAMVALHTWEDGLGPWRVLYLLALVWLADVGAYFAGRAFGTHKLAPRVSPGKTWEGVAGAFAAAGVVVAVGVHFGLAVGTTAAFAALSLAVVAFSIVGDLAESMFKRHQGVKDSGTLLPGHGGLLDRIDSLTAATPLFVGGMLWLG